jgi:hypothetical protein
MSYTDHAPVPLLPSEARADLEALGAQLRLAVEVATADAVAAETACSHCGEPVRPGATLCELCDSEGGVCAGCGG